MRPERGAGVLHLQSRAYPLHYTSADLTVASVDVPGYGAVSATAGELGSLAYNADPTVELDLTAMTRAAITLPGVEIAGCRARILSGGTVLVVYALRHAADLRRLPLPDVDALDARISHLLREADAPILSAVLAAAVRGGLVRGLPFRPDLSPDARGAGAGDGDGRQTSIDRRSVRYNCHLVTEDPPWRPDPRVPDLSPGPLCQVLLPYSYAWDRDPDTPLADLLTMTEPTDVVVAQQSLLFGAVLGGRWILVDLARSQPESDAVHAFRRFLDGVWADYHQLDSYRVESAQSHRATYLAAREVIGLDDTQERAEKLLGYVGGSLAAASAQRTEELDDRLNRVASALTVVAAASFVLDVAVFLLPPVPFGSRLGVVVGVIGLAAAGLIATIRPRRRYDTG